MEFHTQSTLTPPKHLFPCLATITLGAPTSRRLSGSAISNDDGADAGLGLRRVISGNRRRTSFGQAAVRGDTEHAQPRKSFDSGKAAGGGEVHEKGTWYWRVQAGVSDVSGCELTFFLVFLFLSGRIGIPRSSFLAIASAYPARICRSLAP